MTIEEIKQKVILSSEYDFLRTNSYLKDNIILLGLGGSYAYGLENENSDIDIRGCALNSKEGILTGIDYEVINNSVTDTAIYSFNKLIKLLTNCNPNTIEILGLKPEHYLHISSIGQELLDHKHLFLSKRAVYSFGGYAFSQLRRLDNKAVRTVEQAAREQHILNSIESARDTFPNKYFELEDGNSINLYLDDAINPLYEKEIFMDIALHHYPLRDYKNMWSEMHNIVKDYAKIGKRNKHAIEHNKLSKHMCHLCRLYFMGIDILKDGEINTYRENDHDLLMSIRNGDKIWLDDNKQPTKDFFNLVNKLESDFKSWTEHTYLPDKPDYKAINNFVISVNERIVKGDI